MAATTCQMLWLIAETLALNCLNSNDGCTMSYQGLAVYYLNSLAQIVAYPMNSWC